jgi:hypothetical protein
MRSTRVATGHARRPPHATSMAQPPYWAAGACQRRRATRAASTHTHGGRISCAAAGGCNDFSRPALCMAPLAVGPTKSAPWFLQSAIRHDESVTSPPSTPTPLPLLLLIRHSRSSMCDSPSAAA